MCYALCYLYVVLVLFGKYIVGFSIVRCLIQSSHPSDPAVGVILCVFLGGCVLFYDPELVV